MAQKIKVGAVSYLNTKPLIYGFEQGMLQDKIDLVFDYPSRIASLLVNRQIDIGLVPVAVIPSMEEYYIISDYCIGCDGEVYSVCLFSDVPLDKIETILLDYQSKTSVALLKILLKEHWHISPQLVVAPEGYEKNIAGNVAGLVIGDRAILQHKRSKYIYDLGIAWKNMTALPFVFAAWVSNKPLDEDFKTAFDNANELGLANLPEVISKIDSENYDLQTYYTKNISFEFDEKKRSGLLLFLNYLSRVTV